MSGAPPRPPSAMYDYIAGTVASRTATAVVVEAGGVGYELLAPLGAPFPAPGAAARVATHLVVREDSQTLYGFPTPADRDLFRILLKVRGVGPGMALGVLSGMSAGEVAEAVLREDVKAFTAVKGVGKKTAEQILLDLGDKASLLAALGGGSPVSPGGPSAPEAGPADSHLADAVAALVSIGYSDKEAAKRVEAAAEELGGDDLEALVRRAIRG